MSPIVAEYLTASHSHVPLFWEAGFLPTDPARSRGSKEQTVNARQKGQKLMASLAAGNHFGLTDDKATKVIGGAGPTRAEADKALAEFKAAKVAKPERKAKKTAAEVTATKNGKPKAAKVCECGCGGQTKGGRFLMGHDSKLKSRLINASLGGDKKATIRISQLGWVVFLEKSRGSRDRKQAAKASKEPIA